MFLKHTQGDTFRQNITFRKADKIPIDLTDCTITFSLKKTIYDEKCILKKDIEIIGNPHDGQATLSISASDMNIPLGKYFFDIEMKWDTGIVETPLKWEIEITYQVTS